MISLKNLNKYFNKGRNNEIHVINNTSLELPDTGLVAFFGPSGCGKTTLLNCIGGLDGFNSGSLEINGKSITHKTDDLRNQYIGYIFQNYNLNKNETVFENVADSLKLCGLNDTEEIEKRVLTALSAVNMDKYRHRLPDALSGGQQQRVAIARAIVKNPSLILADEPTGNLDEHNTLQVMNLLKAISKDHLVLLVTHEKNLVDLYCDKVIGLSDGKVVSELNQTGNGVYSAKDKRDIWLGELPEKTISDREVQVDYYGETPEEPIKVRIVRYQGKTYLQVDSPNIRVLDETSETRLRNGSFSAETATAPEKSVDLSALTPVVGKKYGRLFTVGTALSQGYRSQFKTKRKKTGFFRIVMALFAAVSVFFVAKFGVTIRNITDINASYNHNVFYYEYSGSSVSWLKNIPEEACVDLCYLNHTLSRDSVTYDPTEKTFRFVPGNFCSFDTSSGSSLQCSAVCFPCSACSSLPLLYGKSDNLKSNEIVISKNCAEQLLELSAYSFIESLSDLLGLSTYSSPTYYIVGIVDTEETAVFFADSEFSSQTFSTYSNLAGDEESPIKTEKGTYRYVQAVYSEDEISSSIPKTVLIHGQAFTLSDIVIYYYTNPERGYESWMKRNNLSRLGEAEYWMQVDPTLQVYTPEREQKVNQMADDGYYTYLDYYYEYYPQYLQEMYYFAQDFNLFLAVKGDAAAVAYLSYPDTNVADRYVAQQYKEKYGRYPTYTEALQLDITNGGYTTAEQYLRKYDNEDYWNEYYYDYEGIGNRYYSYYLLNEEEYETLPYLIGTTDSSVSTQNSNPFAVLHSTDAKKTEEWLRANLTEEELEKISFPTEIGEKALKDYKESILSDTVTVLLLMIVMSLCMYLIMRSTLMGRVKEVGIYRAIGVKKSNINLMFIGESLALFARTVFPGYLVSSVLIGKWLAESAVFKSSLYYPLWLALVLLIVLAIICLLCGTLPVMLMMRKKPAEILAKYDI